METIIHKFVPNWEHQLLYNRPQKPVQKEKIEGNLIESGNRSLTECFFNLSYPQIIESTPYVLMHGIPPTRVITIMNNFPNDDEGEVDLTRYYNKMEEKVKKQ